LVWQPVLGLCSGADLVVVQQELKYVLNPVLLGWRRVGGPRVGFWGHGCNFQASGEGGFRRFVRAGLARLPDWWFAYTEGSARVVSSYGYPSDKLTVVRNTIDVKGLQALARGISLDEVWQVRCRYGIFSPHVGLFCGGLYGHKRLDFLLEAALEVRRRVPDFELVVVGDGPGRERVLQATASFSWIHWVGAFQDRRSSLPFWLMASVLLMPGLVGLVVVDSFALGVPIVTTDYPFHSPEIEYLKNGFNGRLVPCGERVSEYASAVSSLLTSPVELSSLQVGALSSVGDYEMGGMVSRFGEGVFGALA
jgi:glycosyltransferase involved in cell wall biosynthesis